MKLLSILVLFLFGVLCQGRTINVKHLKDIDWDRSELKDRENDSDVSLQKVSPANFLPVSNIRYFKPTKPCSDGFKRDVLGVCREVWD